MSLIVLPMIFFLHSIADWQKHYNGEHALAGLRYAIHREYAFAYSRGSDRVVSVTKFVRFSDYFILGSKKN
jgi:hypothetical protein